MARPPTAKTVNQAARSRAAKLLDADITTYAPMQEGQRYIAIIAGVDFAFRGATPMGAYGKADRWRRTEYEKLTSKSQRAADGEEPAVEPAPQAAAPADDEVSP